MSATRDVGPLVEALRRPLLFAARDKFQGIAQIANLGATLRAACDRLCAAPLPPERVGPMKAWRRELERFEKLGRDQQEIEVARGLRLCLVIGGPAPALPRAALPSDSASPSSPSPAPVSAPAPLGPLDQPVTTLPGIGPTLARYLGERNIETVEDLAWLVPRHYDDLRTVVPLAEAVAAPDAERRTLVAEVVRVTYSRWGRRFLLVVLCDAVQRSLKLTVRWFQVHGGMAKRFVVGRRVVVSGRLKQRDGAWEMANPDLLGDPDEDGAGGASALALATVIRPRYADVEGVAPAILRKACRAAIERVAPHVVDGVPETVTARLGLPPLGEALGRLHHPPAALTTEQVVALSAGQTGWHKRLAFDELFFLGLAVARRRAERKHDRALPCVAPPGALAAAAQALPFPLTGAQRRAIDQIAADLSQATPMSRLLQGDVGAGKTAVAFAAAQVALAAGRQVAIMAPTEILAEQHLRTLGPWLAAVGQRVSLLTASTPRGVRESTLGLLGAGALGVIVGTHALLAERVTFADLGLVVIDEQHRFGVAQRVRLRTKGEDGAVDGVPHLLVMTATPIPRTLALTAYGDLDVSTLDELPPGRTPPATQVLHGAPGRRKAYQLVKRELARGAKVFVVCPLVEASEIGGPVADDGGPAWSDATSTAAELADMLAPHRVGLVHGRMPAAERDAAMAALREGALDVLVATTVIEVGVDVPAATVMVIEDADRFGLAQLHQLRGRVGRGGGASHCVLLAKGKNMASDATRRLAIMAETCDGFRIAEEDLAIRGPGEVFGARQAGLPKLRFGNLVEHAALLAQARDEAARLLADDPTLARPEHRLTAAVLEDRLRGPRAFGAEGG